MRTLTMKDLLVGHAHYLRLNTNKGGNFIRYLNPLAIHLLKHKIPCYEYSF